MAGAALSAGVAGVASAQTMTASGTTSPTPDGAYMSYARTVSDATPTFGDVVTISIALRQHGVADTDILFGVVNLYPSCFVYVRDSVEWQEGGNSHTELTDPYVAEALVDHMTLFAPYPDYWSVDPFTVQAQFRVLCDAGWYSSGGLTWNTTLENSDRSLESLGPVVSVQRRDTSLLVHELATPEVGQRQELRVLAPNVPDGGRVAVSVNGQSIGNAVVSNGEATLPWTPSVAGSARVQATFAQTTTHGGSVSEERIVDVSDAAGGALGLGSLQGLFGGTGGSSGSLSSLPG